MKIVIYGVPIAKQSFMISKSGFKYTRKEVVDWCGQARVQMMEQLDPEFIALSKEVHIKYIKIVYPMLKSFSMKKMEKIKKGEVLYKTTKPDIDNILKNFFDACKTILFVDDSLIVSIGRIEKIYGEKPRIEMELTGE